VSGGDWQLLLEEASQLRRSGRVAEAIAAYERLLAVRPDLADSWYNLGWLQRQARDFRRSLESYRRALDLGIIAPEEVRLNRAVIYSDHLHDPVEAERELRAALAENPNYIPALLNLGNLYEDLGERNLARAAYETILSIEPLHSLALARLAGLSHSASLDVALADRLRRGIDLRASTAAEQADLGFALAALLDAAGEFDQAFEAASAANAASRSATNAHYDRAEHEHFVDRLIAAFNRAAPSETEDPSPIFICGMFRSGSTLVEQILGSHTAIESGGELDLIPALVGQIAEYPEPVATADDATIARWRDSYVRGLPAYPPGQAVTDKRPDNFLHIGLIKTLFPSAKIVHTRRNPLDNLLSLYFLHLDPGMAYALDIEDAAHWYGQYRRLMGHWKSLYPNDIFDVDYDSLVREPTAMVEPLLAVLGLEWEAAVLDFHRRRSAVKTASVWQVRQPLHAGSSGRWLSYERHFREVVSLLS
jgi:tetratricopeptide (TPR) repeat protein